MRLSQTTPDLKCFRLSFNSTFLQSRKAGMCARATWNTPHTHHTHHTHTLLRTQQAGNDMRGRCSGRKLVLRDGMVTLTDHWVLTLGSDMFNGLENCAWGQEAREGRSRTETGTKSADGKNEGEVLHHFKTFNFKGYV